MADDCDAVVIVGSDYTDVASPAELGLNARIAVNLGAPVVLADSREGPRPRAGRARRRGLSGRVERPARPHRRRGGQPLRANTIERDHRGVATARAEDLCGSRRAAAGGTDGRRPAGRRERHRGHRRRRADEPRGDERGGRRHDRRPCARTAAGGRGRGHARGPLGCGARGGECPCRRRVSVVGVHHPQRRIRVAPVRGRAGGGAATAIADHRHHAGYLRHRHRGRVGPRPGDRDVAAQGRHRTAADRKPRRPRGSAGAVGDSDPQGDHAADVHLPAARAGARGSQADRVTRGRRRPDPEVRGAGAGARHRRPDHPRRREPDPRPRGRTRREYRRRNGLRSAHQRAVRRVRRAVRPIARQEGCHRRAGPRDHPRRVVLRHDAGAQRHGRRDGVRRIAHHRPHGSPGIRDHPHRTRHLDRLECLPDVPARSGAGLRGLRDRSRPDRRAARRHRDQRGADRGAVRHRTPGGHAVLFDGGVRNRSRRRQGQGGNRIGAQPGAAAAGRRSDPVRRRRRAVGGGHQDARLAGGRQGHRADLPGPERRQQRLQGGAAQRGGDRDRPGAARVEQAGERPVPRCTGRRHRQHGRDHRNPGAA